jgi:outer membrane receptor for ferrienterochelin and colicin
VHVNAASHRDSSQQHRARGNELYRNAMAFTHQGIKMDKLRKASVEYQNALATAETSRDQTFARRNCAVVTAALADHDMQTGQILSAVKLFSSAAATAVVCLGCEHRLQVPHTEAAGVCCP